MQEGPGPASSLGDVPLPESHPPGGDEGAGSYVDKPTGLSQKGIPSFFLCDLDLVCDSHSWAYQNN